MHKYYILQSFHSVAALVNHLDRSDEYHIPSHGPWEHPSLSSINKQAGNICVLFTLCACEAVCNLLIYFSRRVLSVAVPFWHPRPGRCPHYLQGRFLPPDWGDEVSASTLRPAKGHPFPGTRPGTVSLPPWPAAALSSKHTFLRSVQGMKFSGQKALM